MYGYNSTLFVPVPNFIDRSEFTAFFNLGWCISTDWQSIAVGAVGSLITNTSAIGTFVSLTRTTNTTSNSPVFASNGITYRPDFNDNLNVTVNDFANTVRYILLPSSHIGVDCG